MSIFSGLIMVSCLWRHEYEPQSGSSHGEKGKLNKLWKGVELYFERSYRKCRGGEGGFLLTGEKMSASSKVLMSRLPALSGAGVVTVLRRNFPLRFPVGRRGLTDTAAGAAPELKLAGSS